MIKENKNNLSLIELYKKYSINTMLDKTIKLYLKYILKRFKLHFIEDNKGDIFLNHETHDNINRFKNIVFKANDVINNPDIYYTISDLSELFSLGVGRIRTLIKRGVFEVDAYILTGPHYISYFSKDKIDKIIFYLDNSVTISQIVEIVKCKSKLDLTYQQVKIYLKKNRVKFHKSPVNATEVRIMKDDIQIFDLYPLPEFNLNSYYTISQITIKYKVNAYSSTYSRNILDKKNYKGVTYYSKKEVDNLFDANINSITIKEVCEQLNINKETLRKKLSEYGIEYITGGNKIYKYSIITKENYDKFIDKYEEELEYNKIEDIYEKLLYYICNTQDNENAPESKKLFLKFSVERFNKNKNKKPLMIPFTEIYKTVFLTINKEIYHMYDNQIIKLISVLESKSKKTREEFILLLEYISANYKANYINKYTYTGRLSKEGIKKDYSNRRKTKAYTIGQWIDFGKLVYLNIENEEYLEKAINSRMNSMVWLYCALHYCAAWRKSDYIKKLPCLELKNIIGIASEDFIDWIKMGNTFTLNMGQAITNYIIDELRMFDERHSKNNQPLRLEIGNTLVKPIGFLLALAEAHRKRNEISPDYYNYTSNTILTNACSHKENHIDLFGEEYIQIFQNKTFNNLNATTTYLHNVVNQSSNLNWNIGYYLASVSRGHKLNENSIASTTQIYLSELNKDNDLDVVSFNLYERGIFGFIYHKILSIVYGDGFQHLKLDKQTELIKELALITPYNIEIIIKRLSTQQIFIDNFLMRSFANKEDYVMILNKLSQGKLPSKMDYSQCLLKITGSNMCKFPLKDDCIGCDFLIPEIFFLFKFNSLLNNLIKNIYLADLEFDKLRLGNILLNSYLPLLNDAIRYIGLDRVNTFIDVASLKTDIKNLFDKGKLNGR